MTSLLEPVQEKTLSASEGGAGGPLPQGLWVIVPAYNEAERVGEVLRDLKDAGAANIVMVDDGSSDDSAEIASRENVWVLRHIVNRGQGAALQTGIDFAVGQGADLLVTFDADGQHTAGDLWQMVSPIASGSCQVVLGSRGLGRSIGVPRSRKLLLRFAIWFTRLTTGLPLTDTHNGIRAFTADAALQLRMTEDGMAHASEFLSRLARSGLRWKEVPVTVHYTPQVLMKGQQNSNALQILFRMIVAKVT